MWLRLYAQDGDSDSWLERVDAVNFNPVIANETGAWHWVLARGHSLTVGQHTLDIGGREPGSRVDRILITDDPDFVPSEQPESDVTAPARPGDVTATAAQTTIALGWSQPTTADVERLVVRYRTDGVFPTSPVDGGALVDDPGQPGAAGSFTHEGLANGQTVHYSVFAIDAAGNVSEAATVSATTAAPSPPRVPGLRRTDRR